MFRRRHILALAGALTLGLVVGCSSAPSTPTSTTTADLSANPSGSGELTMVREGNFATIVAPPEPEDNPTTPEKVELGKMLYFDPRLSSSGVISCATCHNLGLGGTDRLPTSIGHGFQNTPRNAPTVLNAAFFQNQFWDGRAQGLEEQAKGPIQAEGEMNMPADQAVARIKSIKGYHEYFEKAFPGEADPITFDNIVKAIAAFERTLITPNDALDRYLRGDKQALSPQAIRGMETFDSIGCTSCHAGPALSSGAMMKFDWGSDAGKASWTNNPEDEKFFRVQTLRNVSLTGPYFHDGSVETLEEAVTIMARVQLGVELTDQQRDDIVAFLRSLVGEMPAVTVPVLPAE
ncbi:MAG: cytochrome-c peroxidase [Symbiobacterium sp.]|uniref:cytochrome-c peroxidase n=1 Tax=Symbiobacterium sp. TaxID=1971213 RepID=UPI003464864B